MIATRNSWSRTCLRAVLALGVVTLVSVGTILGQAQLAATALADSAEAATAEKDRSGADELATLDDYLRRAALNNPGLEAAFLRWRAALETVSQKRALPDPRLTYRHYFEEVARPLSGHSIHRTAPAETRRENILDKTDWAGYHTPGTVYDGRPSWRARIL